MKHCLQAMSVALLAALGCSSAWARTVPSVFSGDFFDQRSALPASSAIRSARIAANSITFEDLAPPALTRTPSDPETLNSLVQVRWLTAVSAPAISLDAKVATSCCVRIMIGWAKPVDRGMNPSGSNRDPAPNPESGPFILLTLGSSVLVLLHHLKNKSEGQNAGER